MKRMFKFISPPFISIEPLSTKESRHTAKGINKVVPSDENFCSINFKLKRSRSTFASKVVSYSRRRAVVWVLIWSDIQTAYSILNAGRTLKYCGMQNSYQHFLSRRGQESHRRHERLHENTSKKKERLEFSSPVTFPCHSASFRCCKNENFFNVHRITSPTMLLQCFLPRLRILRVSFFVRY